MTPAERIQLSAEALRAAGYEIRESALDGYQFRDTSGLWPVWRPVPDLTTPENLGRVVEMVSAGDDVDLEIKRNRTPDDPWSQQWNEAAVIFNVDPVPAPRQVRSDTWKPRPSVQRYRAFRDEVRKQAGDWKPGDSISLVFFLPMPKSWSKAKKLRMKGKPHQQKPDLDNLIKAFLDCFGEDKAVWWVRSSKRWSDEGSIAAIQEGR